MDPKLIALRDAYDTALNHFNYAETEIDIDIAICELNIAELRLIEFLNRSSYGITQ